MRGFFDINVLCGSKTNCGKEGTIFNQIDTLMPFKVKLFAEENNCLKVKNVLLVFKVIVAILEDANIQEVDNDGLSVDTFEAQKTYELSIVVACKAFVFKSSTNLFYPL